MTEEALAVEAGKVEAQPAPESAPTEPPVETPEPTPEAPSFEWADVRAQLTGGNEDWEKVMGRYRSVDAFGKAFMAQRQKLSERAEPPSLGDEPTPEDVAAYREFYGIPESIDDYSVSFGEGYEVSEADTQTLDNFRAYAHENNIPPGQAQAVVEWYKDVVESGRQQMNETAEVAHQEASDALKAEWGREFDGNQNAIRSYLNDTIGDEKASQLRELRMEDGSMLMDNPDILRLLVQPSVDHMGGNMMISGDEGTLAESLASQKESLLALRLSDPAKYKSDDVQSKLARIYEQEARINR